MTPGVLFVLLPRHQDPILTLGAKFRFTEPNTRFLPLPLGFASRLVLLFREAATCARPAVATHLSHPAGQEGSTQTHSQTLSQNCFSVRLGIPPPSSSGCSLVPQELQNHPRGC